jgi:hypothetical protein
MECLPVPKGPKESEWTYAEKYLPELLQVRPLPGFASSLTKNPTVTITFALSTIGFHKQCEVHYRVRLNRNVNSARPYPNIEKPFLDVGADHIRVILLQVMLARAQLDQFTILSFAENALANFDLSIRVKC